MVLCLGGRSAWYCVWAVGRRWYCVWAVGRRGRSVMSGGWSVVDPSTVRPVWVGLGRDGAVRIREKVTVGHGVHFRMKTTTATKRATVWTETTGIGTVAHS